MAAGGHFLNTVGFEGVSMLGIANSVIGEAVAIGNFGWSLVSIAAMSRYHDATDTSAGNLARRFYTLVYDLQQRGIIRGSAS